MSYNDETHGNELDPQEAARIIESHEKNCRAIGRFFTELAVIQREQEYLDVTNEAIQEYVQAATDLYDDLFYKVLQRYRDTLDDYETAEWAKEQAALRAEHYKTGMLSLIQSLGGQP